MNIVYYESSFLPEEEVKISVHDRGFQFGDGAFATLQVREGIPLFLDLHLRRLKEQCKALNIGCLSLTHISHQISEEKCGLEPSAIFELIRLNNAFEGIWRLKILVSGGENPANFLPFREGKLLMILKPFAVLPREPLRMLRFPHPVMVCHSSFKSLAHLNRFYVMNHARENHVDDCITTTERGIVLEAAFGNLFWVQNRTVFTPSSTLPLYFGVTLTKALEIARDLGYEIKPIEIPFEELPREAHFFRTNTMGGIRPIASLENYSFPLNASIDREFYDAYEELILKAKNSHFIVA